MAVLILDGVRRMTLSVVPAVVWMMGGPTTTPVASTLSASDGPAAERGVPEDPDDIGMLVEAPCLGAEPCNDARSIFIDYDALGIPGMVGGEWLTYDFAEVTRPIRAKELTSESDLSLAIRLIISEVGADRLLLNRYGLLEGVGILYTVDNRLDPAIFNPDGIAQAPWFPGCDGGTFHTCADPQQYLGLATWRALNPLAHYNDALLEEAADVAVLAWWLQRHGYLADPTDGATNYVHRCGGAGYDLTTPHCDAHTGAPRGDVAGANPFTGPTVFKAPAAWNAAQGVYTLVHSRSIDYVPWWHLLGQGAPEHLADPVTAAIPQLAEPTDDPGVISQILSPFSPTRL